MSLISSSLKIVPLYFTVEVPVHLSMIYTIRYCLNKVQDQWKETRIVLQTAQGKYND